MYHDNLIQIINSTKVIEGLIRFLCLEYFYNIISLLYRFNWNSMSSDDQARLKGISLHLLAQVQTLRN